MTVRIQTEPVIRQLPPNLVNQIAAGEVITRPASVVKELVENSIDAGSSRIEVTIAGGGTELIRVSDNGCGMSAGQLPLAVASHATSKLPDDASLFHVNTLGFRGEALASIGSVSQLLVRSRTAESEVGAEVTVRGGAAETPAPCGGPVGTVIEVRNLFFNTPVRHRFLKTSQTERGHIVEAFTRLALASPHIHFVLTNNDKPLYDLPTTTRWADRILAFFGDEIADALIPVNSDDGQISVSGYVCDPLVSRGNNRMQYVFLNGRHIRDRSLQHALGEAYRGMLMVGRHPVAFLKLDMSPELVDVNVHPTKLEVRFTDGGRVYSRLLQSLRHQFLTTNLTQRVGPPTTGNDSESGRPPLDSELGLPVHVEQQQRQEVIDWARSGDRKPLTTTQTIPSTRLPNFQPFPGGAQEAQGSTPTSVPADVAPWDQSPSSQSPSSQSPSSQSPSSELAGSEQVTAAHHAPGASYLGFQVHNRYLVTQDESGMVVIDQHALHERVLYERVCAKVLEDQNNLESQKLLVPEPVSLTPEERTTALDARETLGRIGMEIDDFGGETVLIHAYPAMLDKTPPSEMLRVLLEALIGAGKKPDAKDILNHLLSTIACKAAVKAGDPLTSEEITDLLEQRDLYHDTHHCPHGRPTALFFSRGELDRMFGRMGARGPA